MSEPGELLCPCFACEQEIDRAEFTRNQLLARCPICFERGTKANKSFVPAAYRRCVRRNHGFMHIEKFSGDNMRVTNTHTKDKVIVIIMM